MNTVVLGISTDSVYAHKVFTEVSPAASKVNYLLVSDRNHNISRNYRVLNEDEGATYRGTIIINPKGVIVSKMVYPVEVGRNAYEILRLIQALQYNEKTGKSVQANWVPGQQGINRNATYIGRV